MVDVYDATAVQTPFPIEVDEGRVTSNQVELIEGERVFWRTGDFQDNGGFRVVMRRPSQNEIHVDADSAWGESGLKKFNLPMAGGYFLLHCFPGGEISIKRAYCEHEKSDFSDVMDRYGIDNAVFSRSALPHFIDIATTGARPILGERVSSLVVGTQVTPAQLELFIVRELLGLKAKTSEANDIPIDHGAWARWIDKNLSFAEETTDLSDRRRRPFSVSHLTHSVVPGLVVSANETAHSAVLELGAYSCSIRRSSSLLNNPGRLVAWWIDRSGSNTLDELGKYMSSRQRAFLEELLTALTDGPEAGLRFIEKYWLAYCLVFVRPETVEGCSFLFAAKDRYLVTSEGFRQTLEYNGRHPDGSYRVDQVLPQEIPAICELFNAYGYEFAEKLTNRIPSDCIYRENVTWTPANG